MKYDYRKSIINNKLSRTVKKVEKFDWKYKNLGFLVVSFTVSYLILKSEFAVMVVGGLGSVGYLGSFISGLFFTYGLTTPPATAALFLLSKTLNPFLVALIGASGALVSDFLIFKFVKDRLLGELSDLSQELKINMHPIHQRIKNSTYLKWIIPTMAGLIIASPLPDELAVALFAVVKYDPKKFGMFSYISNFLGILVIAYAAKIF